MDILYKHLKLGVTILFFVSGFHAYSQNLKKQIDILQLEVDSLYNAVQLKRSEIEKLNDYTSYILKNNTEQVRKEISCRDSIYMLDSLNQEMQTELKILEPKHLDNQVKEYIRSFYQSLSLSVTESRICYDQPGEENFKDKLEKHKEYLQNTQSYSKKRVENLTGKKHFENLVRLVQFNNIVYSDTLITVHVKTYYKMEFYQWFYNMEEIQLTFRNNELNILAWYDIKSSEMLPVTEYSNGNRKELLNKLGYNYK